MADNTTVRLKAIIEAAKKATEEVTAPWELSPGPTPEVWSPATGYYVGVEAQDENDPLALFVAMCPVEAPFAAQKALEAREALKGIIEMAKDIKNFEVVRTFGVGQICDAILERIAAALDESDSHVQLD